MDDLNDHICGVCEAGGDMICCDGKCLRSFHPKCIGLKEEDIPEDCPFVCSDCWNRIQRCFKCKSFDIEEDLVKCEVVFCGKFYHKQCIGSDNKICPLHGCHDCKEQVTELEKRKQLSRCFRCPKAYDLKHRPRDVHVLGNDYFLCIKHINEVESIPELSKEVQEKMEKRKMELKLKQRQTSLLKITRAESTSSQPQSSESTKVSSSRILPPRMGSVSLVRRSASLNSSEDQIADTGSKPVAANITIERKKRPIGVISSMLQASSESKPLIKGNTDDNRGHYYGSANEGYAAPFFGGVQGDVVDHGFDGTYSRPVASVGHFGGGNSIFFGAAGHFLTQSHNDTYYDDGYFPPSHHDVPYFNAHEMGARPSAGSYLDRHNDFRKRRRLQISNHGIMSRTEQLLNRYNEQDEAEIIDNYDPSVADSYDNFSMQRTAALLEQGSSANESSTILYSYHHNAQAHRMQSLPTPLLTPVSVSGSSYQQMENRATIPASDSTATNKKAEATGGPPVAPQKKIDPNDLFALLSANGLFS